MKAARRHKNFDLLTFEGLQHINDVEKFKGGKLKVTTMINLESTRRK